MAVLETLEGDNMEPEILCVGGFPNMARASLKSWEPSMADVLNRKPRRPGLISGIPAKLRATAANKATATRRPVRLIPARGAAGARPWGGSSGRFVMVGDEFDPESLEGWLTSAVKGVKKAGSAVLSTGSKVVRGAGSIQMDVLRSVAPVAGTFAGKAFAAYTGNPSAMSGGGGGMFDSLMSSFGMGGGSAPAPEGMPAAMPATGGGIPPIYLIGGGALLLVLLLKK